MNHPATFVLPLSASRVLDVLHSELAIGELAAISQEEIARIGCISEASVSRAMPVLVEHGFIERESDRAMNGGRGGYWLRLLPLPDMEGSTTDPLGSMIDPLADEHESPAPTPRMPSTASPCARDQSLIPSAAPMVHDSCFNNSSSMCAREEKSDWSLLTIDGAQFLPIAALERAGQTPESVRQADAKMLTRREYPRDEQVRILFDCLLNHKPIYSAAEIAARSEEPSDERPDTAPATGRHGAGARRRSHAHQHGQSAWIIARSEERDAEIAADIAAIERYAAEHPRVPRL